MGVDLGCRLMVGLRASVAIDETGTPFLQRFLDGEWGTPSGDAEKSPYEAMEAHFLDRPLEGLEVVYAGSPYTGEYVDAVMGIVLAETLNRNGPPFSVGLVDEGTLRDAVHRTQDAISRLGISVPVRLHMVYSEA